MGINLGRILRIKVHLPLQVRKEQLEKSTWDYARVKTEDLLKGRTNDPDELSSILCSANKDGLQSAGRGALDAYLARMVEDHYSAKTDSPLWESRLNAGD